ncbi:unnamed protein product, partial [Arabidopsis halleri]
LSFLDFSTESSSSSPLESIFLSLSITCLQYFVCNVLARNKKDV